MSYEWKLIITAVSIAWCMIKLEEPLFDGDPPDWYKGLAVGLLTSAAIAFFVWLLRI
jgi:hypothetical protein